MEHSSAPLPPDPAGAPARELRMDFREERSGIGELLETIYGFRVVSMPLRAGDYLRKGRFRAERKTLADFASSVCDGRLFRQAKMLREYPEFPVLILEGGASLFSNRRLHPHAMIGAIAELGAGFGVHVLVSPSPEGTAFLIDALDRIGTPAPSFPLRSGGRPKRWRKRAVFFLSGLPFVGPKRASNLLDRFGTLEKVLSAPAGELASVPRIGKKVAAGIRDLLTRPFA